MARPLLLTAAVLLAGIGFLVALALPPTTETELRELPMTPELAADIAQWDQECAAFETYTERVEAGCPMFRPDTESVTVENQVTIPRTIAVASGLVVGTIVAAIAYSLPARRPKNA